MSCTRRSWVKIPAWVLSAWSLHTGTLVFSSQHKNMTVSLTGFPSKMVFLVLVCLFIVLWWAPLLPVMLVKMMEELCNRHGLCREILFRNEREKKEIFKHTNKKSKTFPPQACRLCKVIIIPTLQHFSTSQRIWARTTTTGYYYRCPICIFRCSVSWLPSS